MMRTALTLSAILFPLLAGYLGSYFYPGGLAMAQAGGNRSAAGWGSLFLLAAAMIVGIFSSFVLSKANQPDSNTSTLARLKEILRDFQFIAALFVSPLIFNSVYALIKQNPESVADYLLAYQNGFFWQTVLAGVKGKVERANGSSPHDTSA